MCCDVLHRRVLARSVAAFKSAWNLVSGIKGRSVPCQYRRAVDQISFGIDDSGDQLPQQHHCDVDKDEEVVPVGQG